MRKKKTFRLATLGCRTNQYETQAYRDQLLALGYQEAAGDEAADICIVNTCTVTEGADSSSRHQIRQFSKQNPFAQVVVTGCLAERRPDLIQSIEGVTHVIGNQEKETLIEKLFPGEEIPEFKICHFEAHTRAFVKVQDGCNSYCTYCIIPYVRGRSRSRPINEVVAEVEGLVKNGYQEVVITGINVGDYDGGGTGARLCDLIRAVDQVEGLKRLRLSSIDPDEVDDELMTTILEGKNTCHSLHIVLQAGSNVVLKRMNRKYNRQIFLETIHRLRKASPHFTFTTDIIVGFPGETEQDFEETIEVVKETKFIKAHLFPYSKRERTRAALYPGQMDAATLQKRKQQLARICEQEAYTLRNTFVGQHAVVLTESSAQSDLTFGHSDLFLPVLIKGSFPANQMMTVKLIENTAEALVGEPC